MNVDTRVDSSNLDPPDSPDYILDDTDELSEGSPAHSEHSNDDPEASVAGLTNTPSTVKACPSTSPISNDPMNDDTHVDSNKLDPPDSRRKRQFPDCPDYILDDADELCGGSVTLFPCLIRYMDLTILKLTYLSRVPNLMFIRDEWKF